MRTLLSALLLTGVGLTADPPAKTALLEADKAFAKAAAERGLDGWMSFMADDAARTPRPGEKLVVGKAAVREADAPLFADKTRRLVWEPVDAHAFTDETSGVTSGRYRLIGTDKDGKETVLAAGGYVTVWRKEKDGGWKVVFDTGSPDPAATKK